MRHVTGLATALGFLTGMAAYDAEAVPRFSARYEQKCSLCHVNPSGGGMRTLYASQYLVPEELAFATPEKNILEGIDPEIAQNIILGADFRLLHTYSDDPSQTANFFQMQGDLYVNFRMDDALSLYYDQGISSTYELFGMWEGLPLTGYVKAGRFVPSYGWKFDDHTMYTRADLGFEPPSNTDVGLEYGMSPGRLDLQVAVLNGNRGSTRDDDGKLATAVNTAYRGRTGPFGWSAGVAGYWEDGSTSNYGSGGTFGYLTWNRFTWVGQVDWFREDPDGEGHTTGLVTSNELSYLVRRGVEVRATYDFFDPDWNVETGARTRWGGGVYALPRAFLAVEAMFRATTYDDGVALPGDDFWESVLQLHVLY